MGELTINYSNKLKSMAVFFVSFLAANKLLAQTWSGITPGNIYYNSGNVGIGTANPTYDLEINKSRSTPVTIGLWNAGTGTDSREYIITGEGNFGRYVYFGYNNASYATDGMFAANAGVLSAQYTGGLNIGATHTSGVIRFYTGDYANVNERMRISSTGNIGIGTTTPQQRLHIAVDDTRPDILLEKPGTHSSGSTYSFQAKSSVGVAQFGIDTYFNPLGAAFISSTSSGGLIFSGNNTHQHLNVMPNGNIGIGTATPNTNAKLDVNGNIFSNGKIVIGTTDMAKISTYSLAVNGDAIFNKVKVKLYSTWPDYVFEKDYKLPSLADVEKYIQQNKHLLDIPSAKEVEENGLDLGNNQTLLLKKIEELTLYVIEQNKKIEEQKSRSRKLEERIKKLEKK